MELLKIGTKVFDIRFGWGEIVDNNYSVEHPYKVIFKDYADNWKEWYTLDGRHNVNDFNATLSLTEYDLINGGFNPLSDYNKPKVGDFGYFWDDNMVLETRVVLSSITKISKIYNYYYDTTDTVYQHFSKEIPEFIKEKIN
jgi:hypothetical protein